MTFFEFPGAPRAARAGDGMVHRIIWRVGDAEALDFWAQRLAAEGIATGARAACLRFADPEGLDARAASSPTRNDAPLVARAADIPAEHALLGFHGVRAYARDPERSQQPAAQALGFTRDGRRGWVAAGERAAQAPTTTTRRPTAPRHPGRRDGPPHRLGGRRRRRARGAGATASPRPARHPTPIIDRQYFHSVYFREPSGVLFELATATSASRSTRPLGAPGRGAAAAAQHEPLRERLEQSLAPLQNPRAEQVER